MANFGAKGSLPSISEYQGLRFLSVFLLYVAQGAPIGIFFFAIPAWLAVHGATPLEVGAFLSATSLPWTLKFVNGFIMDRFTFLPMGRRRAWLIGAQVLMAAGLIVFALVNPSADDIRTLAAFSFIIMAATTFQDVAVDGMAVDLIPDDERARANGLMFGGQSIGIAAGTAFTGFAIAAIGLPGALVGNAAFVGVVLMIMVVFRERPGERLLPWTEGQTSTVSAARQVEAWWPLFRSVWSAMFTRDAGLLALAQVCTGGVYGFFIGLMPLIAVNITGWSDAEYSALSGTANLVAGVLGVLVFGLVADKLGSRPASLLGFIIAGALAVLFWLVQPSWTSNAVIQVGAIVFLAVYTLLQIAICASAMKVCSLKVAATQFTLFMAIANLGITLSSAALGPLDAVGGYGASLAAAIATCAIGGAAMYLFNERQMKQRVIDEIEGAAAAF